MEKFCNAAKDGDVESLIDCIMENEDLVNSCRSEDKKTPLQIAVENGQSNIIEILLWIGADPDIINTFGLDCLQTDCVNTIISHEIYKKNLYQSCYDVIMKGCPIWFSEFVKYKVNSKELLKDIFIVVHQIYDDLNSINFVLNKQMKCTLEIFLIDANYQRPNWSDTIQQQTINYISTKEDLIKIFNQLKDSQKTEYRIFKLKMILKNLSLLQLKHHRLKYDSKNLAWTQLEFLITLFIWLEEQHGKDNYIYFRLDEEIIISYIKAFLSILEKSEVPIKNKTNMSKTIISNKSNNKPKLNFDEQYKMSEMCKKLQSTKKLKPKEVRIKQNKLKQNENKLKNKPQQMKKIINELKRKYNHLKNVTTLQRLIKKIQIALEIDLTKDGIIEIYALRRVLQIIGEGLKSTDSSPNITKRIANIIKKVALVHFINNVNSLRDVISHGALFRNTDSNDLNLYQRIQTDLKNLMNVLIDLLYRERTYGLKIFFQNLLKCRTLTKMRELETKYTCKADKQIFSQKYLSLTQQIEQKWFWFRTNYNTSNGVELGYIKAIEEYIGNINTKTDKDKFEDAFWFYNELKRVLYFESIHINDKVIKKLCFEFFKQCFDFNFFFLFNNFEKGIQMNIRKLSSSMRANQSNNKYINGLEEILDYITSDNIPFQAITDLNFNLEYIPSFEIEYRIKDVFDFVLSEFEDSDVIEIEIQRHKNVYFGKKEMIKFIKNSEVSQENCKELENMGIKFGIEFKNIKVNFLKGDKLKACKNIENITSIYGKLVKDMKSYLEGPLKLNNKKNAINTFFNSKEFHINSSNDKESISIILGKYHNQSELRLMDYVLKLQKDLVKLISSNSMKGQQLIEFKDFKGHKKLQSAVEMILFEISQIIFEEDDDADIDENSILRGRDFRNYFAHGNILFDILTVDSTRIVYMNAVKLIEMDENSFVSLNNFKKCTKINMKNIYEIRSTWIEDKKDDHDDDYQNQKEINISYNSALSKFICNNNKPPFDYEGNKKNIKKEKEMDLLSAVFFNNFEMVKKLCKEGADVNVMNNNDQYKTTPICSACNEGNEDIVIELLKYDPDISICDYTGSNPLMNAALIGHKKIIKLIMERVHKDINKKQILNTINKKGANIFNIAMQLGPIYLIKQLILTNEIDINMKTFGINALHYACLMGKVSLAKTLIAANADLNITNHFDRTPIECATECGCFKIVKILLRKKPNLIGTTRFYNPNHNILQMSILCGRPEIAIYLIEKELFDLTVCSNKENNYLEDAVIHSTIKVVETIIKYGKNKINLNAENSCGQTPLRQATMYSNSAMIKCLVSNGADVNYLQNNLRSTCLHYAVDSELFESTIALLECGADVNKIRENGTSPLHLAVERRNVYLVKLLIDCGASIDHTYRNMTPLRLAVILNDYDIIELLLNAGADVNLNMSNENNIEGVIQLLSDPMSIEDLINVALLALVLLRPNNNKVVKLLIKHGANVNYYTEHVLPPLMIAIQKNNLENFQTLLEADSIDKDLKINLGNSPLIFAVIKQNLQYVNLLLEAGADVNICNDMNKTPLIFATQMNNLQIVTRLLEAKANVNKTTNNEKTALFYGVQSGNNKIVQLLIEYGAEVDEKLIEIAKDNNHDEILNILINTRGKEI